MSSPATIDHTKRTTPCSSECRTKMCVELRRKILSANVDDLVQTIEDDFPMEMLSEVGKDAFDQLVMLARCAKVTP